MKLRTIRYDIDRGVSKIKTKLAITLSALGLLLGGSGLSLALLGSASAVTTYSLTPTTFVGAINDCGSGYPAGTAGNVVSRWDNTVGNPAPSLYLQKSAATPDCSSAGATINGVNGITLTELDFDYLNVGHCGAGAPRYNVNTTAGTYFFFGCTYGTHTSAGTGWTHVEFNDADAVPANGTTAWPGFGTAVVTSIDLVFDEGTDQGTGFAYLDNFSINGQVITGPTLTVNTPSSKDACKKDGWKTLTDSSGTSFKNQGDCVSYVATKNKNPANGTPAPTTPTPHTAVGNVTLADPTQTLSFSTQDNGSSASDTGFVNYANPSASLTYAANVTCVNISGNTANFAYVIPSGNPYSGTWVVWQVVDNGTSDTAGFVVATDATDANTKCETGSFSPTNYAITSGDIIVL